MPIAFGQQLVITNTGDMITRHENNISNFNTIHSQTVYIESVRVKNDQQAHAEFLTLLDRHKAGEIADPGIQLFDGPNGQVHRVEKSWTVPDLH